MTERLFLTIKEAAELVGCHRTTYRERHAVQRLARISNVSGYIYLIHAKGTTFYKIGFSSSFVKFRLKQLQAACPLDLIVRAQRDGDKCVERSLHEYFAGYRIPGRVEWFDLPGHFKEITNAFSDWSEDWEIGTQWRAK